MDFLPSDRQSHFGDRADGYWLERETEREQR